MPDAPLEYGRPAALRVRDLVRALGSEGRVRRRPATTARRDFLDTFDWRLYRQGEALEAVQARGGSRLVWRELRGSELRQIGAPGLRFAWDLPEGPFRARLESAVEMRALLPVASVSTLGELLELLDAEGKVVCRVHLEEHAVGLPGESPERRLPPRVRLEPIRGYAGVALRVGEVLRGAVGLGSVDADVLESALAELGVEPADHSTKVRVELRPEMPASEAARLILLRLLETLRDNEEGTRADVDSEFLHDFRVAVRRTRCALGQLKALLPPAPVETYRAEFAWLGSVTTPTRDLDVHLLDLPGHRSALPPSARGDLEPLRSFLEARQRREQRSLAQALGSRRYRKLMQGWQKLLKGPWKASPEAPSAGRPIRQVADARLRKLFRRALKEGRSLGDGALPEGFHELRKTCKKLRYLMEFFQSLYPPAEIRAFVDALKGLQDNLGEFQDLQVQSEALLSFSREMAAEGLGGAGTHLAIGMLVEKLRCRQERARREFTEAFRAFVAPSNSQRFEGLVIQRPDAEVVAP